MYGPMPYSIPRRTLWNAFIQGDVSMDLLRIPIGIRFDLGTDHPMRGQRNTVSFSFDPPQALDRERWADTEQLHGMQLRLDSLEREHVNILRKLKGNEARIAALRSLPASTHPMVAPPRWDTVLQPPSLPALGVDSIEDAIGHLPSSSLDIRDGHMIQLDSLTTEVDRQREQLAAIEGKLSEHRQKVQRLTSLMNASRGPEEALIRFAKGIKRLDVGSCSPTSSEFLINGVNFQGVSFEYAHRDLFVAFDRGRSFDDTWMDADPVTRNVRQLQQSLFFIDTRDLNPRKLTAMRVGFGDVQRTHLHVGYLYGTRENLPLGAAGGTGPGPLLRNHVAEIDAGYAVKKGHLLRLVYARSLVLAASGSDEGHGRPSVGDLFDTGRDRDQAIKLAWSSIIERTRTRADLEARSVSPWFQSFGMGFIRNGSRALEARVDQSIGERWRVRGRYAIEERAMPGNPMGNGMSLHRGQLQVSYRPTRGLTLRAGHMPVVTRMELPAGREENSNLSYTIGGDLRKRWRKLVGVLSLDLGRYVWQSLQGLGQEMDNHTMALTLQHGDRWSVRCGWSGVSGASDSLVQAVSNLTLSAGYRAKSGFNVDAASYLPDRGPTGWMGTIGKQVGRRMTLRLKGESYSRSDLYFSTELLTDRSSDYTWTVSAIYQW